MSFGLLEWMGLAVSPFIGSFLALVILRLPEGQGVIAGRSGCLQCKHTLEARDLIPVFSWVWLKGKCRHCSAKISPFYPLMELGALLAAFWALVVASGPAGIVTVLLGWWLLVLAAIDFRKLILPDVLTLPLIPVGLGTVYFLAPGEIINSLIGALAGFALMFAIRLLYQTVRGREGLGFGDVKLMAAAGAWVGWIGLSGVLLWAVMFALLFAGVKILTKSTATSKTQIPFGTFLCLGIWLVWLYGPLLPG